MIIFGDELAKAYSILDLPFGANADAIRKAYRNKAAKSHPDKHGGDELYAEKFKEISTAYKVLLKRQEQIQSQATSPFEAESVFFQKDLKIGLSISLSEAYNGDKKSVRYLRNVITGNSLVQKVETIEVEIPRRVCAAHILKIVGGGNIRDEESGNLYLILSYSSSQGNVSLLPNGALECKLSLPWGIALQNQLVDFKLFSDGPDVQVKIDGRNESGAVYEVPGKGFLEIAPLFVQVFYELPKKIDKEDRLALAEILSKYSSS